MNTVRVITVYYIDGPFRGYVESCTPGYLRACEGRLTRIKNAQEACCVYTYQVDTINFDDRRIHQIDARMMI